MSRFNLSALSGALLLLSLGPPAARGQDAPARVPIVVDAPAGSDVPNDWNIPNVPGRTVPQALRSTLDALGATIGVPDGAGYSWTPRAPVRNQPARMGLTNYQLGATAPVYTSDDDLLFANASLRALDVRSNALLPTDRVRFPRSLWDVQAGGGYVHQMADGWSWGATLNLGTASDRPFNSLAEATVATLAFLRVPANDQDGWLFYVASTSNGQLGRNIPVPGVAYEFHSARLKAVIGFPFVTIDYRPTQQLQFELNYAAITEVLTRASYHLTDHARLFTAFEWTNQAWFRAARRHGGTQLFLYEKRVGGGFGWQVEKQIDFTVVGGYAFDRFFVENRGFTFRGRNRVDLGNAPFATAQLEFKF